MVFVTELEAKAMELTMLVLDFLWRLVIKFRISIIFK